jgi:hypothetical protein
MSDDTAWERERSARTVDWGDGDERDARAPRGGPSRMYCHFANSINEEKRTHAH